MISNELAVAMKSKGIDVGRTLEILDAYNAGKYDSTAKIRATGVPKIDGESVLDLSDKNFTYSIDTSKLSEKLASLGIADYVRVKTDSRVTILDRKQLERIGTALYGKTAYGVLNGGSATSYADVKKNSAFGEETFNAYKKSFDSLAPICSGKPKGITPAYVNPDGTPGASFLVLKMRSLLLKTIEYRAMTADDESQVLPMFQMTSLGTDTEISEAYETYKDDPFLSKLSKATGRDPGKVETAVQEMLAALSHSSEGKPKTVFSNAFGKENEPLALPGGHGQSFSVLSGIYTKLRDSGIRFAYLGNVDNAGFLPDPVEIAVLALSGKPAAFDFSFRTSVDVKGGILVLDDRGKMNCADIGPAISFEDVKKLEDGGDRILFNCATGLFDLDWLVPNLKKISSELPVRISDQDKDAGKYSQAEQVTWEVMGLLDGFLGFAVDKFERFIAAKLLMETIFSSGIEPDPKYSVDRSVSETSKRLSEGMAGILSKKLGLSLKNGKWTAHD